MNHLANFRFNFKRMENGLTGCWHKLWAHIHIHSVLCYSISFTHSNNNSQLKSMCNTNSSFTSQCNINSIYTSLCLKGVTTTGTIQPLCSKKVADKIVTTDTCQLSISQVTHSYPCFFHPQYYDKSLNTFMRHLPNASEEGHPQYLNTPEPLVLEK